MRRARIKAVATVPVRRKVTQDGPSLETVEAPDIKDKKLLEIKTETQVPSVPTTIERNEFEETKISEASEKENEKINPKEGQKENNEISNVNKLEIRNNVQAPLKPENLQKPATSSSVEVSGSPIKTIQNRSCFMRPTPRLDGGGRVRRNSIQGSGASASESEDDSRKSNSIAPSRVRNDSICSVQSLKDSGNVSNIAKLNLGQKRRMVVSESARKLAEARREFLLRHENKLPDKSKLTMYDLIYYNPVTNPMKPKPTTARSSVRKLSVDSISEKKRDEEEDADEPSEMLVPQVKVGPNGQLIIDEQSLVIDQYKAQENIDRSDIIVDEDTTGNGFYKRRKKSKDWNKWETVKFYKALNTYGTDFLLMQSVFPKRTRQELKLKYKKEERLNRNLVEKALVYQEFDTEALEKDLAKVEENERKESESLKLKKENNSELKRKRKRCQLVVKEINCTNDEGNSESNRNSCDGQSSDESARITITKKVRKRQIRKRKIPVLDTNSGNGSVKGNTDSEPEVYEAQPTRSGRTPRIKKSKDSITIFDVANTEEPSKMIETNNKENNISKEVKINDLQDSENNEVSNNRKEAKTNGLQDSENNEISNNRKGVKINDLQDSEHNEISTNMEIIKNSEIIIEGIDNQIKEVDTILCNKETSNQKDTLEPLRADTITSKSMLDGIIDDIPNIANLKPGSFVVLKKDSIDEPGKTTLQVYIVSSDYDKNNPNCRDSLLPLDLSPDILETVNKCIKESEPV